MGNSIPLMDEKFTAHLSKKDPFSITNVLPPPPSSRFHSSNEIIESFSDSRDLKALIMSDCMSIKLFSI